jgi:hypothetical protein
VRAALLLGGLLLGAAPAARAAPPPAPYAAELERFVHERQRGRGEVTLRLHDVERHMGAGVSERRSVSRMRDSDNAASDLIAHRLGLAAVERGLLEEGIVGMGPVVDLMHVRRETYRVLDPRADKLSAVEVRDVRWRNGFRPRLDLLKKHIGPPYGSYNESELEAAYDEYYAGGHNHAPLVTVGEVLRRLATRELVSPRASDEILAHLLGTWGAGTRLDGALPRGAKLAHKTGTQRRRVVDLGLTWLSDGSPLVLCLVVADLPHEEGEAVLRDVAREAYRLADAYARAERHRRPSTRPSRYWVE